MTKAEKKAKQQVITLNGIATHVKRNAENYVTSVIESIIGQR